jgi:hypothetical protein
MIRILLLVLLVPLSVSCQTKKLQGPSEQGATQNPSSCHIEGRIVEVLKPGKAEKSGVCAKYACSARVRINEVSGCGPGVSTPLNAGDTITMRFTYSLHATKKLFPRMKVQYPGLKKGSVFTANAEQRLQPHTDGFFVVTAYVRK